VDPRPAGTLHPLLHEAAVVISPDDPTGWNPINGREQRVLPNERADLQFACIYPLAEPVPCDMDNEGACDCNIDEVAKNSPLCEFEASYLDGVQLYAKAYPGVRQLQVLQDIGYQGVTTSICPKDPGSAGLPRGPGYGYQPNMDALMERMHDWFTPFCLPRPFDVEQSGQIACRIAETSFGSCDCSAPGRSDATPADLARLEAQAQSLGFCGDGTGIDCTSLCACGLARLAGDALETCQNQVSDPTDLHGYCYVDPSAGAGNPELVRGCPTNQERKLRFLGEDVPAADKLSMIVCDSE
jgi:hypothetical protein